MNAMIVKWILFLLLSAISFQSIANTFLFDINIKNKKVGGVSRESSAKIYTKLDAKLESKFMVNREDLKASFISRFIPSHNKDSMDSIYIEAKVYSIDSGKEKLINTPQILAIIGEYVSYETDNGDLVLKIKATKVE
ncbi:MAG: hypothetical protein HQK49_17365 [Oligoflexia bacterium]|nr:hypothetical protein [Oligoflexia bacterium]